MSLTTYSTFTRRLSIIGRNKVNLYLQQSSGVGPQLLFSKTRYHNITNDNNNNNNNVIVLVGDETRAQRYLLIARVRRDGFQLHPSTPGGFAGHTIIESLRPTPPVRCQTWRDGSRAVMLHRLGRGWYGGMTKGCVRDRCSRARVCTRRSAVVWEAWDWLIDF